MAAKKKKTARKGALKKRASSPHSNGRVAPQGGASMAAKPGRAGRPHANGADVKLNQHGRVQVPCLDCGICCTYVATEVEGPSGLKAATEILWYLYHQNVSVYRDVDDDWLLQFETRCQHLLPDNKCNIYEHRPHICRAFDEKSCEVNVDEEGQIFSTPGEFLAFLQEKKPALYKKMEGRFLPPEDTLDGTPVNPKKLKPFEPRYRRLRVLGEPPKPRA